MLAYSMLAAFLRTDIRLGIVPSIPKHSSLNAGACLHGLYLKRRLENLQHHLSTVQSSNDILLCFPLLKDDAVDYLRIHSRSCR